MKRLRPALFALLLALNAAVHADPIHAVADGAFWHHDSGWIFPASIEGFTLVGSPQDVAGSREAVAYYARADSGARTVIEVRISPVDSAAAGPAGTELRVVTQGAWRVRIAVMSPELAADARSALEPFVRAQRWDSLARS
jgi:hypothetical protein